MKRIITADQVRAADRDCIENEPITSIDLMERAAVAFVGVFVSLVPLEYSIHIVCGSGNNGGDGLAVARLLEGRGYQVKISLIQFSDQLSSDCQANLNRIVSDVKRVDKVDDLAIQEDVVVDAIFGSGLSRPVKGFTADVIDKINNATAKIISIDLPSGLFSETIDFSGAIICADHTIAFQRPKLSFLIPESGAYVGEFTIVDIGLGEEFIASQSSNYFLLDEGDVQALLPKRKKFQHKGDFGRVQVFSGSFGKMGAAFLCGKAVLRVGAGLLTLHIPKCGYEIIQSSLPEAMVTVDLHDNEICSGQVLDNTDVVCAGSGLGTSKPTVDWFKKLLKGTVKPMVLDADALNMLSMHPELMDEVPEGSVITPHVGEFTRLFGSSVNGLERIEKLKSVAISRNWVIVLKGAHSAIGLPSGDVIFNTTGNAGMATAGSGDVLAGVITGLLAQGLSSEGAALAGVFLHGKAGDLAEKRVGKMSLMASDLLNELPEAITNATQRSFILKNPNFKKP